MIELRKKLKSLYDDFINLYGRLNKNKNKNLLLQDIYGFQIMHSLEKKQGNDFVEADVLTKSNKGEIEIFTTEDCGEALAYSLSNYGKVNLHDICNITNKDLEEVIADLGDLIYLNPETNEFEVADKWLSGNVVSKMWKAQHAVNENPNNNDLKRSLEAIKEVQPVPIRWDELLLNFGERWIPTHYYERFATDFFGTTIEITYLKSVDEFKIEVHGKWSCPKLITEFRIHTKGGIHIYGDVLLKHALENTTPIFTFTEGYGDNKVTRQDNDSIQLAADKIEQIRTGFEEWLQKLPPEDKKELTDLYNDLFNCFVLRKFDGSHLKFPGLDLFKLGKGETPIELYPAQKNVIWRLLQNLGGIIDWQVGSGKSNVMIITAYEMKRMKIRRKPCIIALKANVGDISFTFKKAYPFAKVLAPTEQDFEAKNRVRLFYEIQNNDWDCVIMTHDQFGKIPQSPQIQEQILEEEIRNLESDLDQLGYASRAMRKGLEQRKNGLIVKLKTIQYKIAQKQDEVNFESMGIDHLFVDECFPYETLILTNLGWLPIGEIVSEKKEVFVLSYCSESRTFELMPVTNWLKKPLVKKLVKVTHEYGEFTCTEDHKVWTLECGYVKARELTTRHTLTYTPMSGLWEEVESGTKEILQSDLQTIKRFNRIQVEQTTPSQRNTNYFTSVSKMRRENGKQVTKDEILQQSLFLFSKDRKKSGKEADRQHTTMPMVWKKCSGSQKEQVLQCNMQNGTPESTSSYQGTETQIWGRVFGVSSRRQKSTSMLRQNEVEQSNAQSRDISQNDGKQKGSNISIKRRKWTINRASKIVMSGIELTGEEYGMGNSNQTCLGAIPISTKLLQGGYCHTGKNVEYRSGWSNTPNQEMEVSGQTQNRDFKCSRVVSVEIYQQASDAGFGFSDSCNNFVYDLTVEKNHNYFAEGVLVSNCHKYKNLTYTTMHNRVAGLGNAEGSQKSLNMLFAIRTLQQKFNSDLQATFLSGTPISNSLTELYLLFKYLRPNALEKQNISNFDSWAAVFAIKTSEFEFSVTNEIISKERFRHFIKLPELALFYNEIADYQTNDSIRIDKPEMIEELVALEPTEDQEEFIENLIEFAKTGDGSLIGREPPENQDAEDRARMLICTNYAKKMSVDMRLIDNEKYDDHNENKINYCVKNAHDFYLKFKEQKGTQIFFCDIGVPNKEGKFCVYDEIKKKLIEDYEVPAEEIAFIHDYNERTRWKLFEEINNGTIRFLCGSTDKAGTGVNIQQRIVAIHDLDIPWRPSDLEQRGGRAERTGNWVSKLHQDNKVYRFIYATKKSLDTYKFTLLKNKQLFISQMKTNELSVRSIDEGSFDEGSGMNFSEYVAILSGDTSLLEKSKIDKKLAVLENLKTIHYRSIHENKYLLEHKERRLVEVQETLDIIKKDNEQYTSLLQKEEDGTKENPIEIFALKEQLEGWDLKYETNELVKIRERDEKILLKLLKMKPDKAEKPPKEEMKEKIVIIGEYLINLFQTWRPKTGTHYEVLGTLYGFNVCIERVVNSGWETSIMGSNSIKHENKFYVEHPERCLKYTYTHGVPNILNAKIAARNFLNALSRLPNILETHTKEFNDLTLAITNLRNAETKEFTKDQEIYDLKMESKRLTKQIKEGISNKKQGIQTEVNN